MQRLYPPPGVDGGSEEDLDAVSGLARAYAYPEPAAGPYLRANMVGSLDGAARAEGRSAPLSSAGDMRIFGVLRALADVVLVGAETVRQEGYRPARARPAFTEERAARGQTPAPAVAVLSRRLDLDFDAPLFREPLVPTMVLTGLAAPAAGLAAARAAGAEVVVAGDGTEVDPARAVRELADRGFVRLLHEGGPRVLAGFAAAGVLHELCLTVSPLLVGGDAPRIMNGPAVPGPARFHPVQVLEEEGFLFTRWVRH
ncbi:pyrimidine reductase family protein [Actinacidiphila acididurans]|uniref:Pyrimidine reductase family protein n=1 Tax=Actinacidiphila acididurans TaxID=2784346 RepID=A0ABS2TVK7_9ACTN|nr:pyrimidine reductase family protein [Actinacidiphila acididurans]MBM9507375.1 pyrimidine reductase family protein [Actinacidiphila acididurans]